MAKYLMQRHGEVDVKTYNILAFSNDGYSGFEIEWASSQIGWGSCTVLFTKGGHGETKIVVESEHMASNDDKAFLISLFEDIIERAEIVE